MEKQLFQFEDFLLEVSPEYQAFAVEIHQSLVRDQYKMKIERKANGFLVSYAHPKTRRSLLNFLFRKKGLCVRVYADGLGSYADFVSGLPEKMEMEIAKAATCKRLLNPADCNPRCVAGYDFMVGPNRYQKCRYSCFQFAVTAESAPILLAFIEKERRERGAA